MNEEPGVRRAGILSSEIKLPISGFALGIILAILLLAFEQRYQVVDKTIVDNPLRGDAFRYFVIAHNINNYGVYSSDEAGLRGAKSVRPDAVISPGYPVFMSLFLHEREEESDFRRLLIAQAVLGTLTVLLAFLIARQMLPLWASVAAMFLAAISPHLVSLTTYFLTETLFTFLLAGAVLFSQLAFKRRSSRLAATAGILVAAASLTRPSLQYFAPFLLVMALMIRALPRSLVAVLLVAFVLGMSPWWLRNYVVVGSTGDSTLMASTLHHGSYPDFMFDGRPETYGYPYRYDPDAPKVGSSVPNALAAIRKRFQDSPRNMAAWYLYGKSTAFWQWNLTESIGDVFVYPVIDSPYFNLIHFQGLRALIKVLHPFLVLAGMAGALLALALAWRERKEPALRSDMVAAFVVGSLLVYMVALHTVGAPFPRYSIPLRPYLYSAGFFFAIYVVRLAIRFGRKRSRIHDPL